MLHGYFGQDDRPYIVGEVNIGSPTSRANVAFLVDTGSVDTILTAADAARIGVAATQLAYTQKLSVSGLGGSTLTYRLSGNVSFYGGGSLYIWRTERRLSARQS